MHYDINYVLIDNKLTFDMHISKLCTSTSQEPNAVCRASSLMSTDKKRLVKKAFTSSHFSYSPLT